MSNIKKITGVTFITSSDGSNVLFSSGANEGTTWLDLPGSGKPYKTIVSTELTLDTVSDVKVTFCPSIAYEENGGSALGQFSTSYDETGPEYITFSKSTQYVAQSLSCMHVFENVPTGSHTFYFKGKPLAGQITCNHYANNDTNGKGFDIIWAETVNRALTRVGKISGVAVTEMVSKNILFASGTNNKEISLTNTMQGIVSASITLTETSDVKMMFYPSQIAEASAGGAVYQFSGSNGSLSPIFYGARYIWNNCADTSEIIWYLEGLASGTHTFTLNAKEVIGEVYMNGRIEGATYGYENTGVTFDGTDLIYIETLTKS